MNAKVWLGVVLGLALLAVRSFGAVGGGGAPGGGGAGDPAGTYLFHGKTNGAFGNSLVFSAGTGLAVVTNNSTNLVLSVTATPGAPSSGAVVGSGNDAGLGTTFGTLLTVNLPAAGTYIITADLEFHAIDGAANGTYQYEEAVTRFYNANTASPVADSVRRQSIYTTEKSRMTVQTRYTAAGAHAIRVEGATISANNMNWVKTNSSLSYVNVQ